VMCLLAAALVRFITNRQFRLKANSGNFLLMQFIFLFSNFFSVIEL